MVYLFLLLRQNYKSFLSDSCCIVFLVILSISSKHLVYFWAREHLRFKFQTCFFLFLARAHSSASPAPPLSALLGVHASPPPAILAPRASDPHFVCALIRAEFAPLAFSLSAPGRPLRPNPSPQSTIAAAAPSSLPPSIRHLRWAPHWFLTREPPRIILL